MPPRRPPLSLECIEGRVLPSAGPISARAPEGVHEVRVGNADPLPTGVRLAPPEPAGPPAAVPAESPPEVRPPAAPPPDRNPAPAAAFVRFEPAGMPPTGDFAPPLSPAAVPTDPPADPAAVPFDFRPIPALPSVPFPTGIPLAGAMSFDTLRGGAADILAGLPELEVGGPLVETAAWATAVVLVTGGAAYGWVGRRRARRRTLAAVAALRGEETRAR